MRTSAWDDPRLRAAPVPVTGEQVEPSSLMGQRSWPDLLTKWSCAITIRPQGCRLFEWIDESATRDSAVVESMPRWQMLRGEGEGFWGNRCLGVYYYASFFLK